MFKRILFVCIGNICRSPLAQYEMQRQATLLNLDITVQSAGMGALIGHPADEIAQKLGVASGLNLAAHRAQQLNEQLIKESDLVLVMDEQQKQAIESAMPWSRGKVHLLGKWGGFDIPDPYSKDQAVFEQSYQLIKNGIAQWLEKVWQS